MSDPQHNGWIQTWSGVHFDLLDPKPDQILIEDIAHALAHTCRWTGHVKHHYSVAEHSVRASFMVPHEDALWALLHDGSEAFIADVSRPLKRLPEMEGYRRIEAMIEERIFARFGLHGERPESVKKADNILLATEARYLMGVQNPHIDWGLPEEPETPTRPLGWGFGYAKHMFLERFEGLMVK